MAADADALERELDEIVDRFRRQADTAAPRAPLYVALCRLVAGDRDLAALLLHAPAGQRAPVLFLAALHSTVLDEPQSALAAWYPDVSDPARGPDDKALDGALRSFCAARRAHLVSLISSRSTQTNEVARCALLMPVLGLVSDEVGALAHLDVGASAGLNLLWPAYHYEYEPGGALGPSSSVTLRCGTRGSVPVPGSIPPAAARIGLDRHPVDLTDDAQARWLEACVWPDQLDRLARLRAAIALAADDPPVVRVGDAVADLDRAVTEIAEHGHPVLTNCWVLNYLSGDERREYLDVLERAATRRDLTWLFLESPELVPELPVDEVLADPGRRSMSVLTLMRWRSGRRTVEHLATCHPHGYWMHWHDAVRA